MRMSSESDERTKPNSGVDSPSVDDGIEGNVGGNGPLKKGPWTSAEDAILVEYVTKHGEGNWNAVQKHSGLARCGKSCRLRWANHLRPDLKKGAFTPEEERRIIELHAKMGNKWARMAAELPGRTDNEIKNYWNTRIKRRQRAGLPIYPADICLQSLNDNLQSDDMSNLSSGNVHHPELMPINNFDIPAVEFKNMELNHHIYTPALLDFPASNLLDIPASSLLTQSLNSSYHNKSLLPTVHPSKRLRGSEPMFPGLNAPICNVFPGGNQYHIDSSMQIGKSSVFSAYDQNPAADHARTSSLPNGSHAISNGNSSSEPSWAMKLELPSLQTQMGTWGSPSPSSPLPFFESVDILIQTPPNEHMNSCNLSPQNSGLLDAVLYESETMRNSKSNGGVQQTTHASTVAVNTMDDSAQALHETEWRAYEEQLSPLGHSSSSVFSESTPISGNSLDEPFPTGTLPVKDEAINGQHFTETMDGRSLTPVTRNASLHIPEYRVGHAPDPRKQHILEVGEGGRSFFEAQNARRPMPEHRPSNTVTRMDSGITSYSPWTLDRLRRRSPDESLATSRGLTAPKKDEILQRRFAASPYDDARTSTYMSKDAFDISRPMSSSLLTKMAPPVGQMKSMAPVASSLPRPGNFMQKSSYVVDDEVTVDSFLRTLGLEKFTVTFKAEEVDMYSLKRMTERDLKEMGIPMGPRKKILLALQPRLKQPV